MANAEGLVKGLREAKGSLSLVLENFSLANLGAARNLLRDLARTLTEADRTVKPQEVVNQVSPEITGVVEIIRGIKKKYTSSTKTDDGQVTILAGSESVLRESLKRIETALDRIRAGFMPSEAELIGSGEVGFYRHRKAGAGNHAGTGRPRQ